MRKLYLLLSVALMAIFAISCEPEPQGPAGDETGTTFTFQNEKATSTSIEVQVVPSDTEVNYFASVVEKVALADMDDATIIDTMLNSDDFKVRKGPQYVTASNLKSGTEYVVIAFAITEETVARFEITTEAATEPVPADQFKVEIEVKDITATSATAIAKPNSPINKYLFRVVTKLELNALGIYNNDWEIMRYICENPYHGDYLQTGEKTLQCSLSPEMDYIAVAFNYENAKSVYDGDEPVILFRSEFKTPIAPKVDPNDMFVYENLTTTAKGFTLDVTPVYGEESYWTYYIMLKDNYYKDLANNPYNDIVRGAYFGLQNLAVEQGYLFHDIIQLDKLGKKGSNQISNYQPLLNNTEYVVLLFYIDINSADPTEVYDYNHVAVEFKTKESSGAVEMAVSEPIIERAVAGYTVNFNIKVDDSAVGLYMGASPVTDDIRYYWDETDWNEIRAFFWLRPVSEETLAQAKTEEGCVISVTAESAEEYVFFFEAITEENTRTQQVVKVTPEMFANAQ